MSPTTIATILNSAPMIIQGAGKLIDLIRARKREEPGTDNAGPVTPGNLGEVIDRLEARLDSTDEANLEQVKLIEQLARQNEALAGALQRAHRRLAFVLALALAALALALLALVLR